MKSSHETPPGDDLDEYLQGGGELSRAYQREMAPAPPHALDRRVLDIARGTHKLSPCLAPLALAASVLLSVALVLAMLFGPAASKRRDEPPRLIRVVSQADASSGPLAERLQYYSDAPAEPNRWLEQIGALRRAGRSREADAELQRFRRAYPQYPLADPSLP